MATSAAFRDTPGSAATSPAVRLSTTYRVNATQVASVESTRTRSSARAATCSSYHRRMSLGTLNRIVAAERAMRLAARLTDGAYRPPPPPSPSGRWWTIPCDT